MHSASRFSLQRLPSAPSRSAVLRDGADTGLAIDGQWLEGQFALPDATLLFVIDDALLEDALVIYLLDHTPRILDRVELRRMYTAGTLARVRSCGERCIEFSFFGGDRWRLEVLRRPAWRIHVPSAFRTIHRDKVVDRSWLQLGRVVERDVGSAPPT